VQEAAAATGSVLLVDDPAKPGWKKIDFLVDRAFGPAGQVGDRRWPLRLGMKDDTGVVYAPRVLIIGGSRSDGGVRPRPAP
jgi:hypothetical protein